MEFREKQIDIMLSKVFKIRNAKQLPFYCSPLRLFLAIWLFMLIAFEFHISYTSYPDISLALILFACSVAAFLGGYATLTAAYRAVDYVPTGSEYYRIDVKRLRRFHLVTLLLALSLIVLNLKLYGLPPVFAFLGADTLDYQEYGSLRQLLFPATLVLFVSAPLEPSTFRRWMLYAFGPLFFIAYASRGFLLIMLFQTLVVFSFRTTLSKRQIYLVALVTLCSAVLLSNFLGNSRNSLGSAALLGYMQIKRQYYTWPAAYLWVIAYVSTPFSNLCWIVHVYHYNHPTTSFLNSLLPGFLGGDVTKTLEAKDLGSENIVDGVHTYIAKYYLDFWWLGLLGINYLWGLISGYISAGNRLTRNYLTSAVLLGCIGFMFFSDFLTILIVVMELFTLALVQRYFTIDLPEAGKA